MKVLIVEDTPSIRRCIIFVMRRMCDVLDPWAAESVDEAIDHLKASTLDKPFDLVICDYNLLGTRKGSDVLAWIHEHASYLVPRFIFMTSDVAAVRDLHERALEKPCDATAIRQMIESTLAIPA